MISQNECGPRTKVWIIADGKYADLDGKEISRWIEVDARPLGYEISDLAKYIVSPYPVELNKTLVGYQTAYRPSGLRKVRNRVTDLLRRTTSDDRALYETMVVHSNHTLPRLKDRYLESYVTQVHNLLKREDPICKGLSMLDASRLSDIKGICQEIGGNRTLLNLNGSTEEKINYLTSYLGHPVGVILNSPQLSEGLFDMRGFDFKAFNPHNKHLLLSYAHDDNQRCCVLGPDFKPEFFTVSTKHLGYLRLLQKSISINRDFSEALDLCVQDKALPYKLFFYHQLKIDYSQTHCPITYKDVFQDIEMSPEEKKLVIHSLNHAQLGISFSYVPRGGNGKEKPITTISVMHDLRALEPIKDSLPHLYDRISNKISHSGVGNFYFLDSIKGCAHD